MRCSLGHRRWGSQSVKLSATDLRCILGATHRGKARNQDSFCSPVANDGGLIRAKVPKLSLLTVPTLSLFHSTPKTKRNAWVSFAV